MFSGAQQVQSHEITVPGGEGKLISYEANADVAAILAFYSDSLTKDGWRGGDTSTANALHYFWVEGCPIHGLDVKVSPVDPQHSKVEITLTEQLCY